METTNKKILKQVYGKRPSNSKKYDFGLLIVIGGSQFYTGAPAFSAMSAFKAGSDMVYVLAPKRAADIIAGFSPNLATYPLKGDWLDKEDLETIVSMTKSAKMTTKGKVAVVIGGGLGRSQETQETILEYLKQVDVPCVIDADAIHAVSKDLNCLKGKDVLITPHSQEFFVLTGKKVPDNFIEKVALVREEAEAIGAPILLKGENDIISSSTGKVVVNRIGSPYMTVGGTGDVLAGIAGSLMARGIEAFQSGYVSAYINGLAGERAGKKLGESMTALDLIKEIPNVLPRLSK